MSPLENHSGSSGSVDEHSPHHDTIIPNRVFVGGLDYNVTENDLLHVFSQYGTLWEVNIVVKRSKLSKGYGFVTFENHEDAQKLLRDANGIFIKDKKVKINQAVRKQHIPACSSGDAPSALSAHLPPTSPPPLPGVHAPIFSPDPMPVPCDTLYLTTSSGHPYVYHNGVAYFDSPWVSPAPHHWPAQPAPPVMYPQPWQPIYCQLVYQHYQPQFFPNQSQWNPEVPFTSSPVLYAQAPEHLHPVPDGASAQPILPIMDNTAESYPIYQVRAERMPAFVPPHDYGMNPMFSSFQVHPPPSYAYFNDCQ